MSLILHLIRKDFRQSRLMIGIWYPILILAVASDAKMELLLDGSEPTWDIPWKIEYQSALLSSVTGLLILLDIVMRAAIVSKLVHEDSVVGSTAFWLSLPVSAGRLLANKAILLVLAMAVPPIVVRLAVTYQLGSSPGTLTEFIVSPVLKTAFLMMLAVLTPSLTKMAVLGAIMAGVATVWFVGLSWLAMLLVWDFDYEPGLTFVPLWGWGPLLMGCISVICHQYLTLRTKRSLVIALSGIPVLLLLPSGHWFLGGY